jgi:hypothetical protein
MRYLLIYYLDLPPPELIYYGEGIVDFDSRWPPIRINRIKRVECWPVAVPRLPDYGRYMHMRPLEASDP